MSIIGWNGGHRPERANTKVRIFLRGGQGWHNQIHRAGDCHWYHLGDMSDADIVAYEVVPEETPVYED